MELKIYSLQLHDHLNNCTSTKTFAYNLLAMGSRKMYGDNIS